MNIIAKIALQVFTVIMTLAPTFLNLIEPADPDDYTPFYQRITGLGIVFLIIAGMALIASIWIDVSDEKESNKLKTDIGDIKTAIEQAGLKYDSDKKLITITGNDNNNINGNQNTINQQRGNNIGTIMGNNSEAVGHIYQNNRIGDVSTEDAGISFSVVMPNNSISHGATVRNNRGRIFDTNPFLAVSYAMREFAKNHNLPDDKVLLIPVEGTNASRLLPTIEELFSRLKIEATSSPYSISARDMRNINPYFQFERENSVNIARGDHTLILYIGNMYESPENRSRP